MKLKFYPFLLAFLMLGCTPKESMNGPALFMTEVNTFEELAEKLVENLTGNTPLENYIFDFVNMIRRSQHTCNQVLYPSVSGLEYDNELEAMLDRNRNLIIEGKLPTFDKGIFVLSDLGQNNLSGKAMMKKWYDNCKDRQLMNRAEFKSMAVANYGKNWVLLFR